MSKLPFDGLRIIDLTQVWSGPYATNLLANLGAEVIKIEAIQRLDPWRGGGLGQTNIEKPWEQSPLWNSVNLDKYDITLDLTQPQGADIFKRLVKIGDIVTENYTPRVMRNFGLDYPVLKGLNPGIIMISLPAHGLTGTWKDYPGFAFSIEQTSGIPQLTGYPDGPPEMTGTSFSDPIVGAVGMTAITMACIYRQMTGKGQHIDISQIEAMTCLIGDAIVDYTMNGRVQARRGNGHPTMAPHGCYRCKGDDLWVNIAISSDDEWRKFSEIVGNPAWTKEDRFASCMSRWQNQHELDKLVETWTIEHSHYEVMNTLQKVGIAAGAVLTSADLLNDPHLRERGTFQYVERVTTGVHPYLIPTAAMKLSESPVSIRRPSPFLGEHNEFVFGELLGLSRKDIQTLIDDKIIGKDPLTG